MIAASVFEGLDFEGLSYRARALRMSIAEWNATAAGIFDSPTRPIAPQPNTTPAAKIDRPSRPRTGGTPIAGVRAPQPAEDSDELRRRPAMGGGGAGGAGRALPAKRAGEAAATRPVETVRTNLAHGAQPAVVKLASYASGRARTSALLTYQSHQGELSLERHDGSLIQGKEGIQALVAQWQDEMPAREPSKDVLSFTLSVGHRLTAGEISSTLGEALDGHRYVWRQEDAPGQTRIHVVMSAASSQRDGEGRAFRIFDNRKSLGQLEHRLSEAFGGETTLKADGFVHGVEGAALRILRLTKGGELPATTGRGQVLAGDEVARAEAKSWKRDLRSTEQRDIAHIIFSAKPGTDKAAFLDAVRATLDREFSGHDYVFALHTNRAHIHVHAAVKMQSRHGNRIDPKIQDLTRWRETLAEEARQRHIPMEAVSRFEQANVPGYKLKDIRRVERGSAPESARRRVEASRTRAIHIPTREEGRKRANEVAHGWAATAMARAATQEPPRPDDSIRFYRAERPGAPDSGAPLFARERHVAETLAASFKGSVAYVDVPRSRLSEVIPSRTNPDSYVVMSRELAAQQHPVEGAESRVLELRNRTRIAAETVPTESNRVSQQDRTDQNAMPTLEHMSSTLDSMRGNIDALIAAMPEERRSEMEETAKHAIRDIETAIDEKRRQVESRRPKVEGHTFVPPKPSDIGAFRHRVQGDEVHYYRDTPKGEKLAFVDNGKQVKIHEWKDQATVLTALKLADQKWDGLTISGSEAYKSMVVSLAAEHGFKITNPELQQPIAAERQRLGKSEAAEIKEGKPQEGKPEASQVQKATSSTPAESKAETRKEAAPPASIPESGPEDTQKDRLRVQQRALEARAAAKDAPLKPEPKPADVDPDQKEALKALQSRLVPPAPTQLKETAERTAQAQPPGHDAKQQHQTRPPVEGIVHRIGEDHYKNDPKNDVTGYVDIMSEDGRVHRIWSVQVHAHLRKEGAVPGDIVTARFVTTEPVQKNVKVTDETTGEAKREDRTVERGVWRVTMERQAQKPEQVPSPTERDKREEEGGRHEQKQRDTHRPRHKP